MIFINEKLDLALNKILQDYNVIGNFIYMSELLKKGGEEKIFVHLQKIRKDCFEPNDRIVFIQDCPDEYHFDVSKNTPGYYLSLIYKYLQQIDITNCFVTIVSSNPDIKEEIHASNKKYSTLDDTQINFILLPGIYTKTLIQQDTFCALMWKTINLTVDADVTPCCEYKFGESLGNLKKQSLNEILHSEVAKNIRKNMLTNKKSAGCQVCYNNEKHGKQSTRLKINKEIKFSMEDALKITSTDGNILDNNIKFDSIQLALDKICNLKCRVCSGDSSKLIALEEKELFNLTRYKGHTTDEKHQVVEKLKPYLLKTKVLDIAGGEPILIKEYFKILDFLIENKKQKDIKLQYSINGSVLSYKDKSILDYWNRFDTVDVTVSVDGYSEAFEYLRHGANWETTQKNVQRIQNTCPHVNLHVHSVVSAISLESIIELQRNWHTMQILSIDKFNMTLIVGHDEIYDVQTLPRHHKKRIASIIDEHCNWLKNQNQPQLSEDWSQIKNYMMSEDKTHCLWQAKKNIELIDAYRNENFYQVFPQLSDMFDDIIAIAH